MMEYVLGTFINEEKENKEKKQKGSDIIYEDNTIVVYKFSDANDSSNNKKKEIIDGKVYKL